MKVRTQSACMCKPDDTAALTHIKDIAFEFGSAISPIFKLYLLKEYQRLKDEENDRLKLEWDANAFRSKNNYLIHTDAIKTMCCRKAIIPNQPNGWSMRTKRIC